jgi:hypothetical protein
MERMERQWRLPGPSWDAMPWESSHRRAQGDVDFVGQRSDRPPWRGVLLAFRRPESQIAKANQISIEYIYLDQKNMRQNVPSSLPMLGLQELAFTAFFGLTISVALSRWVRGRCRVEYLVTTRILQAQSIPERPTYTEWVN